ncbi:MAG: type II toxin-antitoxin system VapC family toxin [Chloroflexi bacterium]|nr:type II toxin-antitoxin system VapC family toxin [Chloroflexota bacterium]
MPRSHERSFEDDLPTRVCLDTCFIIETLVEDSTHHTQCKRFAERLAQNGVQVIYSAISQVEFWNVLRKLFDKGALNTQFPQQTLPDRTMQLQHLYNLSSRLWSRFFRQFSRHAAPVDGTVLALARPKLWEHRLKPHDAIILATALRWEFEDLVSMDMDFRSVDYVHLWNDHIFG